MLCRLNAVHKKWQQDLSAVRNTVLEEKENAVPERQGAQCRSSGCKVKSQCGGRWSRFRRGGYALRCSGCWGRYSGISTGVLPGKGQSSIIDPDLLLRSRSVFSNPSPAAGLKIVKYSALDTITRSGRWPRGIWRGIESRSDTWQGCRREGECWS